MPHSQAPAYPERDAKPYPTLIARQVAFRPEALEVATFLHRTLLESVGSRTNRADASINLEGHKLSHASEAKQCGIALRFRGAM